MILSSQEDYTITVDNSKIYFSIGGNVHWKYFNTDHSKHLKRLTEYHMYRKREIGHKSYHAISVNLPDSLLGNNLKIKKGFYAVNVDSVLSFKFDIHNFITEINTEAGGHIGPYFNIPKNFWGSRSNLFIISPDRSTLKKIIPLKMKESNNSEINLKISDLVSKYFTTDERALINQMLHHGTITDSLNKYQTKEKISSLYNLFSYKIDENCYSAVGIKKGDDRHIFLALIFPNEDKIILKTNTYLLQTFIIEEEVYVYYRSHGSHNGAVVYSVSKIVDNELKKVFSDGSFSM